MRKITVYKGMINSRDSEFVVVDNTLSESPKVLGQVEMTKAEAMSSGSLDNFKTSLKSKVYTLVVEKLGEDIEYSIKLDI
jgi:hypothetical protein